MVLMPDPDKNRRNPPVKQEMKSPFPKQSEEIPWFLPESNCRLSVLIIVTLHRGERGLQKGRQAALVKADNKKPAEKPGLVLLQPADQRKGDGIIGTDHRIILLCFFKKMMKAGSGMLSINKV